MLKIQGFKSVFIVEDFCKQFFKAQFLNVYYRISYIDFYNICLQYENHFTIVKAKNSKQIFFVAIFFYKTALIFGSSNINAR